jgi:hypothetical protein
MRGLAALLRGAVEPIGRLPVDIPRADAPGEVLYPFGAGRGF